jgi:hypothetical protein
MNIGICWQTGALKSLLVNIVFWKVFYVPGVALYDLPLYLYRPGGALYYLPLYHFFDLDPLSYRIVQISILAASIPLVYYLSRRLASSRSIAFLTVLALCYHPRLAGLVFVGAFIYDVLCGFFFLRHWPTTYISARKKSLFGRCNYWDFSLYVCALNCKKPDSTGKYFSKRTIRCVSRASKPTSFNKLRISAVESQFCSVRGTFIPIHSAKVTSGSQRSL